MAIDRQGKVKRETIGWLMLIGTLPYLLNGFYNSALAASPVIFWMSEVLSWFILPGVILACILQRRLLRLSDLGFHWSVSGRSSVGLLVAMVILAYAVVQLLYTGSFSLAASLFPTNYGRVAFSYRDVLPEPGALRFLALLFMAVTAGAVEEFYYRGMFRLLFDDRRASILLYIVLSSVVFASVHWEGGVRSLFATFWIGVGMASLYVWMRNLWPLIIAHTLVDVIWLMGVT